MILIGQLRFCHRQRLTLDPEAIKKAREGYKRYKPKNAELCDQWDDVTFLNKAHITIDGKITRAALILLGKEENEWMINPCVCKVRWCLKTLDNRNKDYEIYSMPLILAVDELASNVRNTKVRFLRPGSMQPDMPKRYDDFTLREPLCNCIAHQLWTAGARIEVVEFEDDRLIFQNYGPFIPTSVMQVVMNDSPSSYYLNPFLVEAMRNVDLIDTEGGGIKHLFELQRERMFPMPEYDINDGKVKLTITGHVDNKAYADLLVERPELTLEEVMHLDCIAKRHPERLTSAQIEKLVEKGLIVKQGQDYIISMEGTSKSVLDDLNDRQKDALTFFKGKISSSDYANRYGVSTKTAKRDLSDMSDKKLIDIEGDRKTSRYIFAQ